MATLSTNVFVGGQWYGPSYVDAGDPPAGSVTNGLAYDESSGGDAQPDLRPDTEETHRPLVVVPPKAGPGSSRAKWAAYAESQGVPVAADDSREDIVASCEKRGVHTED